MIDGLAAYTTCALQASETINAITELMISSRHARGRCTNISYNGLQRCSARNMHRTDFYFEIFKISTIRRLAFVRASEM